MKRWMSLVLGTVLSGCVSADGGAPQDPQAGPQGRAQCFRAADVTNYSPRPPHAVFVLTRRGQVFGLVAENCFPENAATISLAQSRRGNPWLCPGDQVEVAVSGWHTQGFPCLARITEPIVDPEISGFRARGGAG